MIKEEQIMIKEEMWEQYASDYRKSGLSFRLGVVYSVLLWIFLSDAAIEITGKYREWIIHKYCTGAGLI